MNSPPTGHSPSRDAMAHGEHATVQHVQALFDDLGIDVQLRGLLGGDRCRVTDVFCPEIRRSPFTPDKETTHLDVVSCWKGLTLRQASEIAYWEGNFASSLEKMISDVIVHAFTEYLRQENEPVSKWTIIANLATFIADRSDRLIDITISDLVAEMIKAFYYEGTHLRFHWFTSTGDLPTMVFNFVRTRDCFLDSYPYPSLEVNLSHDQTQASLHILGDVAWQLPLIEFYNVPSQLPPGAEYRITASYVEPTLSTSFVLFPTAPEYIVSSKQMPLAWDSSLACFRAIVPDEKAAQKAQTKTIQNKKMETIFSAKIVENFPDGVRFEKTTRYKIKLGVRPKCDEVPRGFATSLSIDISRTPDATDIILSSDEEEERTMSSLLHHVHADQSEPPQIYSSLPSYTSTPPLKRRRRHGFGGPSGAALSTSFREHNDQPLQHSISASSCLSELGVIKGQSDAFGHIPPCGSGSGSMPDSPERACDAREEGALSASTSESGPGSPCETWRALESLKSRVDRYIKCRREALANMHDAAGLQDAPGFLSVPITVGRNTNPQKRKAAAQIDDFTGCKVGQTTHLGRQRVVLDATKDNDTELGAKRPRLLQSNDEACGAHSDCGDDANETLVPHLANCTTGSLGQANRSHVLQAEAGSWFANMKSQEASPSASSSHSRAYEASGGASKVMPALKKNGSVKRMVFKRNNRKRAHSLDDSNGSSEACEASTHSEHPGLPAVGGAAGPRRTDTPQEMISQMPTPPGTHREQCADDAMSRIQQNYNEFLRDKEKGRDALSCSPDKSKDEKDMERVFMLGSDSSEEEQKSDVEWESDGESLPRQ